MKAFIRLLLSSFLLLSLACKKKTKAAENEDDIIVEMKSDATPEVNTTEFRDAKNCDEFIDQYEEWMEDYVALMEKYKGNPVDLVTAPEYTQMTMQAVDWASKWSTHLTACATNSSYERRFKEINEKAEKKLKEIGLK